MSEYKLIRSGRKTISLEISKDAGVIVRAPMKMPEKEIDSFVEKHLDWISEHKKKQEVRIKNAAVLTKLQIADMKNKARDVLSERVNYYGEIMGLRPADMKITSAKTRFGSCSPNNSICFSYLLMQYPPEAIDYVVVHELAHIRYHNHGKAFYRLIEKYLPDYTERRKLLKK